MHSTEKTTEMKIHVITELSEIINENSNEDLKNIKLYIDIDKTCMTPEKIIARAFNSNYVLRNRIILNTKKLSFGYNDNLIPTRHDFNKFISECKNTFKYVAYVTNRPCSDFNKIKHELSAHHLPTDIDIVNQNNIRENLYNETFYYVDSDEKAYQYIINGNNQSNKSKLFKLSIC